MPTSILHTLSSFLSRRYNLSGTLSDRDRESLAHDVAYCLKHIPTAAVGQQLDQTASVEDGNDELETALEELDQTMDACELSLQQFEKKERFLYLRIEKYRQLIRERECYIRDREGRAQQEKEAVSNHHEEDEQNEEAEIEASPPEAAHDVENNDINNCTKEKISQLRHKHTQDQTSLEEIVAIHADIIAQIETLKRRIIELADKKQDILKKREECQEFLVEFAEGK